MIERLYRFRSLELLLGKQELKNQEIFFAHPDQLYDPMEGLRDIFWRGDKIVWRNLLRHYVIVLDRACSLLAIGGEDHPLNWDHLPVLHFTDPYATPQHKALVDEVVSAFFAEPAVDSYLGYLADRPHPIRSSELAVHLRALHMLALRTIYGIYERRNLIPPQNMPSTVRDTLNRALDASIKQFELIKRIEDENADADEHIDVMFTVFRDMSDQLELLHKYNGDIDPTKINKNRVFLSFCDDYVKKIERLVYPEWYTACFTTDCRDPAIWGTYSNGHRGICLIFKVAEKNGISILPLNQMNGWNSAGPTFGKVDTQFHEVRYGEKPVEVDFFKSLMRLPIPMLNKYWYYDEAGQRSPIGEAVLTLDQTARKQYWDNFNYSITNKLEHFKNEKEHRLVMTEFMLDYSDENKRKGKYDFQDLEGIIFGIKTPEDAKLEISRLIEDKCRTTGRFDFKFYQAFYSRRTGAIEHRELGLLKFQAPPPAAAAN